MTASVDFWTEPVAPGQARAYAARWTHEAESLRFRAEYAEGRAAYWTARASRSEAEGALTQDSAAPETREETEA